MPEQKSEPGFKFIDRRRVDESGEKRETGEIERQENSPATAAASAAAKTSSAPSAPQQQAADDEEPANGPVTFSLFLQSLAQQTMMAMGVIPWPDSGLVKANLDHARETIDILTILQEKTNGNLTPSEKRFFDSVLYELKVAFVEILKRGKSE